MRLRCLDPKHAAYPSYGGRGITLCERWQDSPINFLSDMGEKPTPRHEIDRIDNDKGYSPDNCRWATRKENDRNRRSNRLIEFRGEVLSLAAWCERFNIHADTVGKRLSAGWTIEKALTTPARAKVPNGFAKRLRNGGGEDGGDCAGSCNSVEAPKKDEMFNSSPTEREERDPGVLNMATKKKPAPIFDEISTEESQAAIVKILRGARAIVFKIFGDTSKDAVIGVADLIRNIGEELAESSIASALEVARKLGAAEVHDIDVVSISDILLNYEQGEEFMTAAYALAKELIGDKATLDDAIDFFYEIYAEEEDEFEND